MTDNSRTSSRRSLLKTAAAAITTTGIAGCLYTPVPSGGPAGDGNGNDNDNGDGNASPGQRPQTGPRTQGAFLYESFEGSYNMVANVDESGSFTPNYDDAITIDTGFSRAGNRSLKLTIDYNWTYPSGLRRGTNKPIPDNRDAMQQRGYSTWGEPIWFAFSLGVPPNWKPDGILEQVMEFHREPTDNPGDTHQAQKEWSGNESGKPITTIIDGRELQFRNDWTENGQPQESWITAPNVTLQSATWYDIVMNLKWVKEGMDDTGFVRIWVNGHLVMDHEGNTTARDVSPPRPPELRIYKWPWDSSSPDNQVRSYYFDEVRYGWGDATYQDMVPGARGETVASHYPEWWTT